jgi:hypothetical protein
MYLFHLLNKIIISIYTQNDAIELLRCYKVSLNKPALKGKYNEHLSFRPLPFSLIRVPNSSFPRGEKVPRTPKLVLSPADGQAAILVGGGGGGGGLYTNFPLYKTIIHTM